MSHVHRVWAQRAPAWKIIYYIQFHWPDIALVAVKDQNDLPLRPHQRERSRQWHGPCAITTHPQNWVLTLDFYPEPSNHWGQEALTHLARRLSCDFRQHAFPCHLTGLGLSPAEPWKRRVPLLCDWKYGLVATVIGRHPVLVRWVVSQLGKVEGNIPRSTDH